MTDELIHRCIVLSNSVQSPVRRQPLKDSSSPLTTPIFFVCPFWPSNFLIAAFFPWPFFSRGRSDDACLGLSTPQTHIYVPPHHITRGIPPLTMGLFVDYNSMAGLHT